MSNKKTPDHKEVITNRIMVVIVTAFFMVFGLMQLYNYMALVDNIPSIPTLLWSLMGVSCAGVIAGVVLLVVRKKRGVDERVITFTSRGIIAVSLLLLVIFLMAKRFYIDALSAMYIVVPVLCALYIIFYVYNMDFFWLAMFSAFTAAALYGKNVLLSLNHPTLSKLVPWGGIIVLAICAALTLAVRSRGGVLRFGGVKFNAYKPNAVYWPVFAGLAVDAASLALAAVMGGSAVTYGLIAVGAFTLLAAIFYTVRLMYE